MELGDTADARRTYEELIGQSGGSNPDDINNFISLLAASSGHVDADTVRMAVANAIADARQYRREMAAGEGATIVELRAEDGVRIEATLRPGSTPRALVFVPETGARRAQFKPYAQLLALDGITTLTLDPRGHGDSRCDSLPDAAGLPEEHRARISDDIASAVRYLRDARHIPVDGIAIIAEGDASAFTERALHEHSLPVVVVYLSPIFDPDDRAITAALSFRPPRPALLLASNEDVYAVSSLGFFLDAAGTSDVTTRVLRTAGHGANLLRDPANFAAVQTWTETALSAGN
jgi:alpha-beta hydrolase superfamily lysophospholipase